jgi:peptidoglycan/LPS O-acetylase OafA/YrhL
MKLVSRLFTIPPGKRVLGLDVLRAIAILAVVLTHGNLFLTAEDSGWFTYLTSYVGVLGVELFFVLSGFLIGGILLSLESSFHQIQVLPHFWLRRWFRTLPNYWFFLIVYILATILVANSIPNLVQYLTFTQNWLWPHPLFFDQAWSLAVEEWFYLLFPISLFLFFRLTKSFNLAFLISACIFLVLPGAIRIHWALLEIPDWGENFRKVMFVRLDAIMYGVLAAWLSRKFPQVWEQKRYFFLAMGFIIQGIAWYSASGLNFNTSFFAKTFLFSLISLGFAFVLPACALWHAPRGTMLTTAIHLIALWSYSLYLCNFLVAQVLTNILEILPKTSSWINLSFFMLYLFLSVAISCVLYTFLEKPATDLRERFASS